MITGDLEHCDEKGMDHCDEKVISLVMTGFKEHTDNKCQGAF